MESFNMGVIGIRPLTGYKTKGKMNYFRSTSPVQGNPGTKLTAYTLFFLLRYAYMTTQ
jgi:hypothetical protein